MSTEPEPDRIIISFYADTAMLPFILSSAGMGLMMLQADALQFDLKTAVLERGLLVPADLEALLAEGEQVRQTAETNPPPSAPPDADDPDAGRALWSLTLPDIVLLASSADFAASAYLTSFGTKMREVQVTHNGVPAAEFEARLNETLGYLGRFQQEWHDLFDQYPSYRERMTVMAALRAEFAE